MIDRCDPCVVRNEPLVGGQQLVFTAEMPVWARAVGVYTSVDTTVVSVVGAITGITYINDPKSQHFNWNAIAAGLDRHLIITVNPKVNGFVWVTASPDPTLVTNFYAQFGNSGASMIVSQSWDIVAPWLAPNKAPATGVQTGVGTKIIVAAVGGQICYLFGGELTVAVASAGGFVNLQDTAGTLISQARTDTIGSFPFQRNGAPLPVGLGIQITNSAGVTSVGSLAYSQA